MGAKILIPLVESEGIEGAATVEVTEGMESQEIEMDEGDTIRFRDRVLTITQAGIYQIHEHGVSQLAVRERLLEEEERRFGQPHYGHD